MELVFVEDHVIVILWDPIVVVVVVGHHGLLVAVDWQMMFAVAIDCSATVVGVEYLVVFLLVLPLQQMKVLIPVFPFLG